MAWLSLGRFAFPLQFSTALEWGRLFTCRYSGAASTALTSSLTHHKQTYNKGAYRRNCVFHSWHVDVFNNNGQAYENAWDLSPAAETVPQAVEEEVRDVRAGVLRYLNSLQCTIFCELNCSSTDIFLAHFGPLSTNWALFKHHSLPEYCCWPYPSLYDSSVPIFWWLLPAG